MSRDRNLSISARPKRFKDLVGQGEVVQQIRKQISSGRLPAAWLFSGPTGSGKTTLAKIVALSLQCSHQEKFGNPCSDCRHHRKSFNIYEVNAAEASKVEETEQVIAGAFYKPQPPSLCRVYLFDEAQKLSAASQSALLKYFEESPRSTVWMICTTEPEKILLTLRRRCVTYNLPGLEQEEIGELVRRLIKESGQGLRCHPLIEKLNGFGISSPGWITMAVERYLSGESAEKAAQVGGETTTDTLKLCRATISGDWDVVRGLLSKANPGEARALRASVAGYLKSVLLRAEDDYKARRAAEAVDRLAEISVYEDGLQFSALAAALFSVCRKFRR